MSEQRNQQRVPEGHTAEGLKVIEEQRAGLGAGVVGATTPVTTDDEGKVVKVSEKDRLSGRTSADDPADLGVKPGRDGHQGPEDALDADHKGDYRGRLGEANYSPHTGYAPQAPNAGPHK